VRSDVELGGNDQLFNMLAGRTLQKHFGKKPQSIIGTNLLNAANGEKMSTSQGNCIWIDDEPNEMFGAIMTMRDSEMISYFEALTQIDLTKARKMIARDPRDAKLSLARDIVSTFHDENTADIAKDAWIAQFSESQKPAEMQEIEIKSESMLSDILIETNFIESRGEFRRLLEQGGIKIDGEKISKDQPLQKNQEVQIGKRKWVRGV